MTRPIGPQDTSTSLHRERLDAVMRHLATWRTESVLDLGCGCGALLERLLGRAQVRRVVGVDRSARALQRARHRLTAQGVMPGGRLSLRLGCATAAPPDLVGFDAAVLVETIEHIEPGRLSSLERGVFARLRPNHVIITTPNREYNALYGLADGERRRPDHRFEWDRTRFEAWASGVAHRNAYAVAFEAVGPLHAWLGGPTQMALFRRPTVNHDDRVGARRITSRRTASPSASRRPGR